jgi:hypothetical protein
MHPQRRPTIASPCLHHLRLTHPSPGLNLKFWTVAFSEFLVLELLRLEMCDVETLTKMHQKFNSLDRDEDGYVEREDVVGAHPWGSNMVCSRGNSPHILRNNL